MAVIEGGITVEYGITIEGSGSGFTLTSADLTYTSVYYGGYSAETSTGFTSDPGPSHGDTYNGVVYTVRWN